METHVHVSSPPWGNGVVDNSEGCGVVGFHWRRWMHMSHRDERVGGGMTLRQFISRAPSSSSAADDMTDLMIWTTMRIAPLLGGSLELLERGKWPPTRLRALGSYR